MSAPIATPEEAFRHLAETFASNERLFPDLMEPYSARLADAISDADCTAVMQAGLRETIRRRFRIKGEG